MRPFRDWYPYFRPPGRRAFRDLLILFAVGIIAAVLASGFRSLELFKAWAREQTGPYGLLLVFAGLIVIGVFFRRRWREFAHESHGRARAEEALRESEAKLIQSEKHIRDMALLSEMAQLLQASRTLEEAYGIVAESMQRVLPHEPGALCMLSASRNFVEAVAVWGEPSTITEHVFSSADCWALRRGETHVVRDLHPGADCQHVHRHPGSDCYLCVPMMAQSDGLGILHVQLAPPLKSQPAATREREVRVKQRLVVTAAGQIGLALGNLKLREALRVLSTRDALTGLFNRRYLQESLERDLERAARNQQTLGVVMIDLDHFKQLNDTFGHEAGDAVLRAFAGSMQALTRRYDIACRYGGEEFTLILPEATLSVAVQRAERLREAFKHLDVQYKGRSLQLGTLSAGVANFPQHGATADSLLRAADVALYRAKTNGRDRVVVAEAAGDDAHSPSNSISMM